MPQFKPRSIFLAFVSCCFFTFWFRPLPAFRVYSQLDDLCYLEWAARAIGHDFPACYSHSYPPGAAIAFFPAALLAALSSIFTDQSFSDIILPTCVGILSFLYWVGSFTLITLIFEENTQALGRLGKWARPFFSVGANTVFSALVWLLAVPVLYYSSHRTTMVHSPEFFFSLLAFYCAIKGREKITLGVGLGLSLLRINDFPALGIALLKRAGKSTFIAAAVLFACIGLYVGWVGFHGYNGIDFAKLYEIMHWKKLWRLPFGGDWGLVWSAPFWLFLMIYGIGKFKTLSPLARAGVVWMGVELLVVYLWKGNGSDFAYRYLIGSYPGALMVWLELLKNGKLKWIRVSEFLLAVNAFWLSWLTWIYKEHLDVAPVPNSFGIWSKRDLQFNSFSALFDPNFYWLPLRHSTLRTLYVSWSDPRGVASFSGGVGDYRFCMTAICSVIAIVGIFYFGFKGLRLIFIEPKPAKNIRRDSLKRPRHKR